MSHSIERLSIPKSRIEIDRDLPANDFVFEKHFKGTLREQKSSRSVSPIDTAREQNWNATIEQTQVNHLDNNLVKNRRTSTLELMRNALGTKYLNAVCE